MRYGIGSAVLKYVAVAAWVFITSHQYPIDIIKIIIQNTLDGITEIAIVCT